MFRDKLFSSKILNPIRWQKIVSTMAILYKIESFLEEKYMFTRKPIHTLGLDKLGLFTLTHPKILIAEVFQFNNKTSLEFIAEDVLLDNTPVKTNRRYEVAKRSLLATNKSSGGNLKVSIFPFSLEAETLAYSDLKKFNQSPKKIGIFKYHLANFTFAFPLYKNSVSTLGSLERNTFYIPNQNIQKTFATIECNEDSVNIIAGSCRITTLDNLYLFKVPELGIQASVYLSN